MDITNGIAFWGGVVSVFSPCVFPLIPSFYAQLVAFNPKGKPLYLILNTIFFILGFTFVFIFLGANASIIGQFLFNYLKLIQRLGGLIIVILGLSMLEVIDIKLPAIGKRGRYKGPGGVLGSFLLGVVLGSSWLPCVGPVLASILILSTSTTTVIEGIILLGFYSLGFAIPIIISMLLVGNLVRSISKFLPIFYKLSGVILIIVGILVFFDFLSKISIWLGGFFLG